MPRQRAPSGGDRAASPERAVITRRLSQILDLLQSPSQNAPPALETLLNSVYISIVHTELARTGFKANLATRDAEAGVVVPLLGLHIDESWASQVDVMDKEVTLSIQARCREFQASAADVMVMPLWQKKVDLMAVKADSSWRCTVCSKVFASNVNFLRCMAMCSPATIGSGSGSARTSRRHAAGARSKRTTVRPTASSPLDVKAMAALWDSMSRTKRTEILDFAMPYASIAPRLLGTCLAPPAARLINIVTSGGMGPAGVCSGSELIELLDTVLETTMAARISSDAQAKTSPIFFTAADYVAGIGAKVTEALATELAEVRVEQLVRASV